MKAIVRPRPGFAAIQEVADPVDDVVEVYATSLNKADWHMVMAKPWFIRMMKISVVGLDIAGVVRDGPDKGTAIIADVGTGGLGGHAELASVAPDRRARMPANLSFEEAACIPTAGLTALQGLRDWGQMKAGDRVLINGASGGVGSFAVQVAKARGAHVTGMCSGKNVEFVRSLGADVVWDYEKQDIDGSFDVIFDAAAYRPFKAVLKHVTPEGKYVLVGGKMALLMQAMLFGKLRHGRRLVWGTAAGNRADLEQLVAWVEDGTIRVPHHHTIAFEDVPEAIVAMGSGRTVGKVAVKIRP